MKNRFVPWVLAVSFVFLSLSMASATCVVTPKSLSMDISGVPTIGQAVTFTVEQAASCDGPFYYYFSYKAGHGTSSYDTNDWINMRSTMWSTDNSVTYSFPEAGTYVVVAWVSDTEAAPNPIPLIGTTVTVSDDGGSSDCVFDSAALNVTVSDAITGAVISGATISAGGQTATTSSSGQATLAHLPTNAEVAVSVTANGYVAQSTQVFIECGQAQNQGFALLSSTDQGVTSGDIRVILTWGENPRDLDSHMAGPKTSGTDRFHVYYSARNNCSSAPCDATIPAWLDVDDTTSYGPETVTIQKSGTQFTAGTYNYYIHHYSGDSNIPGSGAVVKVYKGATELRSFSAPSSSQAVGDDWVWSVFSMDVTASGSVTITPINTYSGTYSASDTTIFRSPGQVVNVPEQSVIFSNLPQK